MPLGPSRSEGDGRMTATPQVAAEPHAIADGGRPRTAVVGILGGGQLGKMMSQAASQMGVTVKVLDPTENCPASSVAEQVSGSFANGDDVVQFAQGVDILTVEIEHVDTKALEAVDQHHHTWELI